MFSKLVSLMLILCIYDATAATYEEVLSACKVKYSLPDDAQLDYYMKYGEFEPGKDNLKCFFECMANDLGIKSADGSINAEALRKLAKEHTHCQEIALFGSDEVLKQCIKSSYKGTSSCEKINEFLQCAIQLKNKSS